MRVVVGLGNPGAKYRDTRHNVGFDVVAELARRHDGARPQQKFRAEIVEVFIAGEKTLLVAPQTFMNLSGDAVAELVRFYDLPLEELLAVCDDMNLPTGRLRLRRSGSAGGQKGLQSMIVRLGSEEFPRLRIGIGRPPERVPAPAWVLGKFRNEERDDVEQAVQEAADGIQEWISGGIEAAMNRVNARQGD